jgi:alpha-1,6-mannosyltransferase
MKRLVAYGLFVILAASVVAMLLLAPGRPADDAGALALVAAVAYVGLIWVEHSTPVLNRRLVLAAAVGLVLLAVIRPIHGSHDVWSYAMYGRTVSAHGANPYEVAPAAFPQDPLLSMVSPAWRHTRSVYGPLFTVLSAGLTALTGTSLLATRLVFQSLSGLAVVTSLVLLYRRGVGANGLVLLGLHPLVIFYVVNGGHNDALVGLGILAAVVLAVDGRARWACVVLALAGLVKIAALLSLAALVVWLWRRDGFRAAARAAVPAGVVVVGAYLAAGGAAALRPLQAARLQESRISIWNMVGAHGLAAHDIDLRMGRAHVATASILAVLVIGTIFVLGRLSDTTPALAAGAAAASYLLMAAYVLPWYLAWAIPVLALQWRARTTRLVAVWSAAVLLAYQYRPERHLDLLDRLMHGMVVGTQAVSLAAVLALLAATAWRLRPRHAVAP